LAVVLVHEGRLFCLAEKLVDRLLLCRHLKKVRSLGSE
jgi:hypothetical protein